MGPGKTLVPLESQKPLLTRVRVSANERVIDEADMVVLGERGEGDCCCWTLERDQGAEISEGSTVNSCKARYRRPSLEWFQIGRSNHVRQGGHIQARNLEGENESTENITRGYGQDARSKNATLDTAERTNGPTGNLGPWL
jgi:hypothetical protein